MKQNVYDLATDLLKERVNNAFGELKKQYKTSNPYRKVPVPNDKRIEEYLQTTPEQLQFARQNFGDEAVNQYLANMQNLVMRRLPK